MTATIPSVAGEQGSAELRKKSKTDKNHEHFRRSTCDPDLLKEYVATNPSQNIELVTGENAQKLYQEYLSAGGQQPNGNQAFQDQNYVFTFPVQIPGKGKMMDMFMAWKGKNGKGIQRANTRTGSRRHPNFLDREMSTLIKGMKSYKRRSQFTDFDELPTIFPTPVVEDIAALESEDEDVPAARPRLPARTLTSLSTGSVQSLPYLDLRRQHDPLVVANPDRLARPPLSPTESLLPRLNIKVPLVIPEVDENSTSGSISSQPTTPEKLVVVLLDEQEAAKSPSKPKPRTKPLAASPSTVANLQRKSSTRKDSAPRTSSWNGPPVRTVSQVSRRSSTKSTPVDSDDSDSEGFWPDASPSVPMQHLLAHAGYGSSTSTPDRVAHAQPLPYYPQYPQTSPYTPFTVSLASPYSAAGSAIASPGFAYSSMALPPQFTPASAFNAYELSQASQYTPPGFVPQSLMNTPMQMALPMHQSGPWATVETPMVREQVMAYASPYTPPRHW